MKPKKKEIIVLDRNNLLAQPVTLSMLPFTASLTQIKVINAVVRKLQDIFKKSLMKSSLRHKCKWGLFLIRRNCVNMCWIKMI